jgi:trans-aconitate methyltransferase
MTLQDRVENLEGSTFRQAASVIGQVQDDEQLWMSQGDPYSPYTPWMPFQAAEFMAVMFDCVPELAGREFLDVGCGPGTKMRLARHFFGMNVNGIERDRVMAEAAAAQGVVFPSDALKAPEGFYAGFDLIWLYRPFRDIKLEEQLEQRIASEMKPGAILAGGGWEIEPHEMRWHPVVDDLETRHGAWMKPARTVKDVTPGL